MCSKELLLLACLFLLGGLRLTSTTTTTTFVAAMSIANQDLERYFRSANATQTLASMAEERIVLDVYNYAYLNYTYMNGDRLEKVTFEEEKARYGEGKIFTVYGKVVHITQDGDVLDDTACTTNLKGTRGDSTPAEGISWIALVRRGRCTFEEKVKNVYAMGASGVIIYNDKPVMSLEKMQIKGKERNITAVITYLEIGIDMARIVDQGIDINAAIIQGRSGSRPVNTLNKTSVLFVSISFIVLMVISLVWLIFYYVQRFRYIQTKDQQSRQLCSVTKKAIMKIPTKTGKSTDEKDLDSDCCAICIEAYKPSDCIRVLPCKHEFHKNCIDPWLIEHRTCPMCKLDVLKFYGFVFLGSEESILEYEPNRTSASNDAASTAAAATTATGASTLRPPEGGALSSLIRSRDFVIDFPRVFVLDSGSTVGTRESLFPARPPERSQSSMSLAHAKDWMSVVTNKLDEQHGLRRLRRKSNNRDDMEEHLLEVARSESVKKRRSRSADGRYSHGFFGRKELARLQAIANVNTNNDSVVVTIDDGDVNTMPSNVAGGLRRATLRNLTEATYAQSAQRQTEEELNLTARRRSIRRDTAIEIPLQELTNRSGTARATEGHRNSRETAPPIDMAAITIQINGEDID